MPVAKTSSTTKKATRSQTLLAFDTETTGLDLFHGCKPFYVSTCDSKGNIECWRWDVDPFTREPIIPSSDLLELKILMTGARLIGHNVGFDIRALDTVGIGSFDWSDIEDTMIISHAVNAAEPHGLKALAMKYLWINSEDESELQRAVNRARTIGRKLGWRIAEQGDPHFPALKFSEGREPWKSDLWLPRAVAKHFKYEKGHPWYTVCDRYAQWDAVRTMRLFLAFQEYERWAKENDPDLHTAITQYRTLNYPVLKLTYEMETQGIPVSRKQIKENIRVGQREAAYRNKRMSKMFPGVNFGSPQQLSKLLYKDLGLPALKRTATGAASTDKKTLVKLALAAKLHTASLQLLSEKEKEAGRSVKFSKPVNHQQVDEFLTDLLTVRKIEKLEDALAGYSDHIVFDTGRPMLHPRYHVTGTRLTRMSSYDPNQQNVAKDDDGDSIEHINRFIIALGLNPRAVFCPPPDELWFAADGNQLQLRIFAAVSGDKNLNAAFENDEKLHNFVARKIFRLPDNAPVSDAQKRVAKGCNFGSIFGASDRKIDATAGAEGIANLYAELFPDAKGFMSDTMNRVLQDWYVTTPGGYRLPADAGHCGVNYIVSGCEGELMKRAMVRCAEYLETIGFGRVLMQIHDEILFGFKPKANPIKNRDKAFKECLPHLRKLKALMESAGTDLGMRTPMEFKFIKHSWADGEPLNLEESK